MLSDAEFDNLYTKLACVQVAILCGVSAHPRQKLVENAQDLLKTPVLSKVAKWVWHEVILDGDEDEPEVFCKKIADTLLIVSGLDILTKEDGAELPTIEEFIEESNCLVTFDLTEKELEAASFVPGVDIDNVKAYLL